MRSIVLLVLLLTALVSVAGEPLHVSGYGVKSCLTFTRAADGLEQGSREEGEKLLHYRQWLAGLVTGLTLATGENVLGELTYDDAMKRIALYCEGHSESDFFSGAMDLVKSLNSGG